MAVLEVLLRPIAPGSRRARPQHRRADRAADREHDGRAYRTRCYILRLGAKDRTRYYNMRRGAMYQTFCNINELLLL